MAKLKFTQIYVGFQKNNRFYNVPSIFLKVKGCNLMCINNGEPCKNAITENTQPVTMQSAKKFIKEHSALKHIVICGGEPLMYKEDLEHFLDDVWKDGMQITIYTNGTLPILNPLPKHHKIALYVVNLCDKQFPEPGDSITVNGKKFVYGTNDVEKMHQIDIQALQRLCIYGKDYLLNFSTDPNKIEHFITETVEDLCKSDEDFLQNFLKNHSPYEHIVLSPRNKEEIKQIKEICEKTGYFYFNQL